MDNSQSLAELSSIPLSSDRTKPPKKLPLLLDHLARSECKAGALQTLEKRLPKMIIYFERQPGLNGTSRSQGPIQRLEVMRPSPAQLDIDKWDSGDLNRNACLLLRSRRLGHENATPILFALSCKQG